MLPTRRPDLLTRVIDGEVVILDQAAGKVHQLNATASCIWERCDGANSVADITAYVADCFDISVDAVSRDVATTLIELEQLGLLQSGSVNQ